MTTANTTLVFDETALGAFTDSELAFLRQKTHSAYVITRKIYVDGATTDFSFAYDCTGNRANFREEIIREYYEMLSGASPRETRFILPARHRLYADLAGILESGQNILYLRLPRSLAVETDLLMQDITQELRVKYPHRHIGIVDAGSFGIAYSNQVLATMSLIERHPTLEFEELFTLIVNNRNQASQFFYIENFYQPYDRRIFFNITARLFDRRVVAGHFNRTSAVVDDACRHAKAYAKSDVSSVLAGLSSDIVETANNVNANKIIIECASNLAGSTMLAGLICNQLADLPVVSGAHLDPAIAAFLGADSLVITII